MIKNGQPFFSIVVPTYNRAEIIKATIESILVQSFKDFEVIIIDDGGTDNTEKVIKSFNDERLFYFKKENAERGAARNFGGKMAKGKYITFIDSDDLFYKNHLKTANEFLNNNGFVDVFFQQYEILKENGDTSLPYVPKNSPINDELIELGNFMSCQGVFLKRIFFSKNQFRENKNFNMGEDYELWLRIASKYKIYYSPKITSAIVQHSMRSVKQINSSDLIKKKSLMLAYLKADGFFMERIGNRFKYVEANTYLYIALHLSMIKNKNFLSILYLVKALKISHKVINRRSFYITIYKIIFS